MEADRVFFHDDGCTEMLVTKDGGRWCPVCKLHPDMQSTAIGWACPFCHKDLGADLICTGCDRMFEKP